MKIAVWSLVAVCVFAGSAGAVEQAAKPAAPAQQQAPNPEAQKQAMMEKMRQAGTPSEGHKVLEKLAGTWNYEGEFRMSPDAAPETMKGVVNHSFIFGGRFLKQDISGPPMAQGMPDFQGVGYTGYNNMTKQYETVWMDNMGTGMMLGKGTFDTASNTLSSEGTFSCPATGEMNRWFRDRWKIVDANHLALTSYAKAPDGKEVTTMEMRYTRVQ